MQARLNGTEQRFMLEALGIFGFGFLESMNFCTAIKCVDNAGSYLYRRDYWLPEGLTPINTEQCRQAILDWAIESP